MEYTLVDLVKLYEKDTFGIITPSGTKKFNIAYVEWLEKTLVKYINLKLKLIPFEQI